MNSILDTIKKMLGIEADYTAFDTDIMVNINSALMALNQLGVGPKEGFAIHDSNDEWRALLGEATDLEAVKTYIYLKVKMVFDPPSSSFVTESMNRTIEELAWRLSIQADIDYS